MATEKNRTWHVRNDFPTSGNQALDEYIDLMIDNLISNVDFDETANKVRGIRATLARLQPGEHNELVIYLADMLSQVTVVHCI